MCVTERPFSIVGESHKSPDSRIQTIPAAAGICRQNRRKGMEWRKEEEEKLNKKTLCSDFREEKKRSKLCGFWKGRRVTTLGKWWKHQTRHKDKNIWEKGVILVDGGCLQLFFDKKWLFFIGLCVENHGQCGWKLKCDVEGKFYILLVWGTAGRTCPSYPATFVKDFWISTFPLQPRLHIWSP